MKFASRPASIADMKTMTATPMAMPPVMNAVCNRPSRRKRTAAIHSNGSQLRIRSRPQALSFTLEVHQAEGRLPLADAAGLFSHWRDTTNAERMNYRLAVLAENALLVSEALAGAGMRKMWFD